MSNRQKLRLQIYQTYRRWCAKENASVVRCPWCGDLITDQTGFHVHEWLVKRSGLNTKYHDLIMVTENCVPMHPECHERHGQRVDAARRILEYVARTLGADKIGRWYVKLWREHGLSVPRGLYREPYEIPLYTGREMFTEGFELLHKGPRPESWTHPTRGKLDVRDCAFSAIVTSKRTSTHRELAAALPETFAGIRKPRLIEYARTGVWLNYLRGVIG
ncbi:MAG: hypothetical protein GY832_11290 [Chloroflexi bacterium]|nr:hypothetical protein [Chloroflexota bacterium]